MHVTSFRVSLLSLALTSVGRAMIATIVSTISAHVNRPWNYYGQHAGATRWRAGRPRRRLRNLRLRNVTGPRYSKGSTGGLWSVSTRHGCLITSDSIVWTLKQEADQPAIRIVLALLCCFIKSQPCEACNARLASRVSSRPLQPGLGSLWHGCYSQR
jgi:hypothetical protein